MKLATENYDSDDGCNRTPPLLPTIVNLKPPPSPKFEPRLAGSRRPKTQPSQGDEVLIDYMGCLNRPDIATRAGEEPLNSASEASESEASDSDPPMDKADSSLVEGKGFSLVQVAQDALPLVDGSVGQTQARSGSLEHNGTRRIPPKLHTQNLGPSSEDFLATVPRRSLSDRGLLKRQMNHSSKRLQSTSISTHDNTASFAEFEPFTPGQSSQPSRSRGMVASPQRTYDVPALERSAMTLPAMQKSPSSLSANSSITLPSIQEQIGPFIKGRITKDYELRSSGSRRAIPLINGSAQSPILSSISSRPSQLPSPQTRMNSHFQTSYLPNQQSPASTYSDTSPRELSRQNQGSGNMVSPKQFGQSQHFSDRPTPQRDDLIIKSAESPQSGGGHGINASVNDNYVNAETTHRTLLPPLGNTPAMTGSFKCDHVDCNAPPFNTQYLLK